MNREERINRIRAIDIYPVTCQAMSEGRTNLEILDAVMAAGAGIIQLREKNWTKKAIHGLALEFRKRTYGQQILLIINDHVDIALAVGNHDDFSRLFNGGGQPGEFFFRPFSPRDVADRDNDLLHRVCQVERPGLHVALKDRPVLSPENGIHGNGLALLEGFRKGSPYQSLLESQ